MKEKIPMIVIVGATATGKTNLAIEIAKIKNGEIVSADSMQIYRGLDIGTAKPSKLEMELVPHHMIDILDISENYSVAEYVKDARKVISEIYNRHKIPILVGGTGLYINSILDNIQYCEEGINVDLREELYKKAEKVGKEGLLKELSEFDPESAQRLANSPQKRILRAIEIYESTGVTMTEQIKLSKSEPSPYNLNVIGLNYKDRKLLYDKINKRVEKMVQNGLIEEAKKVWLSSDCSQTARSAIAYKEFIPYFNGECDLQTSIEKLKTSSRRYAKRQITWFKRDSRINWIYVDKYSSFEEVLDTSLKYMNF